MTIFRSSLVLLACIGLAGCGPTASQQRAEAAARNEAAQREVDLDQVRSDVRNLNETAQRLQDYSNNIAAEDEASMNAFRAETEAAERARR